MSTFKAGQLVGVLSGTVVATLVAIFTLELPAEPTSSATFALLFAYAGLAVVAIVAALAGHPGALLVSFVLSFLPLGLYLSALPGPLKWAGLAVLGYPVSAALVFRGRRQMRPEAPMEPS